MYMVSKQPWLTRSEVFGEFFFIFLGQAIFGFNQFMLTVAHSPPLNVTVQGLQLEPARYGYSTNEGFILAVITEKKQWMAFCLCVLFSNTGNVVIESVFPKAYYHTLIFFIGIRFDLHFESCCYLPHLQLGSHSLLFICVFAKQFCQSTGLNRHPGLETALH